MEVVLLEQYEHEVNQWDHRHVIGRCPRPVTLPEANAVVAHVYQLADIRERAPLVERVDEDSPGYCYGAWAYVDHGGLRMVLQAPQCNTAVVLHECAHLLTEDPLDEMEMRRLREREMHGQIWLTNYLWLLHKLMGPSYNGFYLRSTLPAAVRDWSLPFHPIIRGTPRGDLA